MQGSSKDASGAIAEREIERRPTKEDWLTLAVRMLVTDGIESVKIQVMAKKLLVSRSSFYWHFNSMAEFKDQMLAYWIEKNTSPVIERAMSPSPTITAAVCKVFECWVDDELFDPSLDMAVRLWGRRDEKVRSVVKEADDMRLGALTRMYLRHGYPDLEAQTRARTLYFTQIGYYTLEFHEELAKRLKTLHAYILTLTGKEPKKQEVVSFEQYARSHQSAHS